MGTDQGQPATIVGTPRRFIVAVPQTVLDRISAKLALSEVGYAPIADDDWQHGTSAAYLKDFLDHWRDRYDWRAAEARLNQFPQFKAQVEDIDVQFYHVKAARDDAPALLLTHGWPGSVVEFFGVIDRLAHPENHGGSVEEGFHVIVPSLPGYGFSSRPPAPIGPQRVAHLWRRLMTEALGYESFFAQGGDWGAAVTSWLGSGHSDVVRAIHFNLFMGPPWRKDEDAETSAWRKTIQDIQARESGYAHEQMTRPQTIGLALSDSPLGFASWVLEKFHRSDGFLECCYGKRKSFGDLDIAIVERYTLWRMHI